MATLALTIGCTWDGDNVIGVADDAASLTLNAAAPVLQRSLVTSSGTSDGTTIDLGDITAADGYYLVAVNSGVTELHLSKASAHAASAFENGIVAKIPVGGVAVIPIEAALYARAETSAGLLNYRVIELTAA